jgi:GTPase involved in cell partitioning and DNA repair
LAYVKNFLTIERELAKYDQELADKPRLLAINKMDLLSADERAAVSTKIIKAIKYGYSLDAHANQGASYPRQSPH